jgi:glycosyltransferase involved in cell wall biosynthesis
MPVSLLEAMNAGLLVISSRVGGVPYMINEDKNGLLFQSDNADELAEKMRWALEHPEEVKQMIAQAQANVQKYSWNNVRKQLLGVYNYE